MNQTTLIARVAAASGHRKDTVEEIYRATAAIAAAALVQEGEVVLAGLGKLVATWRDAREIRSPATGEPITIPGHRVVKYRIAKAFKDAVA